MGFQLSFVGLLTVAVYYTVFLALIAALSRAGLQKKFVAVLSTAVLALPWIDEVWIAWHFNRLCRDAGVQVMRSVKVDGYYDGTYETHTNPPSPQTIEDFERRGYLFYENRSKDKYVRKEKIAGQWQVSIHDHPTARYYYRRTRDNANAGYQLEVTEYDVFDSGTEKVIGRKVIVKRYSSWLIGLFNRMLGGGMTMCPDPGKAPNQPLFPEAALIPMQRSKILDSSG